MERKKEIPKEKRKEYPERDTERAIKLVKDGKAGYLKAAQLFSVPRTMLFRLCHGEGSAATRLGRKPIFPDKLEKLLVSYLLEMENNFFGMTRSDLRCFAFSLVRANKLPNPFNKEDEIAGK